MRSGSHIASYITRFNTHASNTSWNDASLAHRFYQGLPSRLKDEITRSGRPNNLPALRALAQDLDARYWRREEELKREAAQNKSSGQNKQSSGQQRGNNSGSSNSNSNNSGSSSNKDNRSRQQNSGNQQSSASTSSTSSGNKTDRPKLPVGADGKLTSAEKERRRKNNLCMYCGHKDHTAENCPERKKPARGRAAQTADDAAPLASSEPSK